MIDKLALATVLALAACGPAIPPVPSQGGPAWRELTSEHFTLWTNTSAKRARELIREMEDLRHVVIGVGFRGGGAGRVLVIALRDDDEVRAFTGEFRAMASSADNHINQPWILMSAEAERELVAHELTHTISFTVIRDQPRWFAEGLAKYFETIKIDRERGKVDLGRAPTYRGEPIVMSRLMAFRRMVACKELSCADRHFYASAWALFTYLKNVKQADVTTYPQLVAGADLDELEAEVKRWLVSGSHTVLHYDVRLPTYAASERALGDADVYAARALLRLEVQGRRDLAQQDAAAALAVDPTHVLANVVAAKAGTPITAERARAIAQAHPDDWRAWMLVVTALREGDEARAAFERACELAAQNPALITPCPTR